LGGLDTPTSGGIFFDGQPLATQNKKSLAHYRRFSVGMIFQNFNLITTMTAQENVNLALAFGGLRGAERAARARELLAKVGLGERLAHRPAELSGGEQQRVAIARALANRPRVLLADEPTGNLDSTRAIELLALLKEMVEQEGLTVLMVTHDRELAARFANRLIMMKDGRVAETRAAEN
jgi:putative ABC transport system ATP-binding protein